MAGLFVDQGEGIVAEMITNYNGNEEDLQLKLYVNDKTPADGDDETDYTEPTFTGYAPITLTGASWVITPGAPTVAAYPKQTFTASADSTLEYIRGYLLVQSVSGKLVSSEKFSDGPYAVVNINDYVEVTPTLNFKKSGE